MNPGRSLFYKILKGFVIKFTSLQFKILQWLFWIWELAFKFLVENRTVGKGSGGGEK
jgi:hypothetical protein